jgi:predicted permease
MASDLPLTGTAAGGGITIEGQPAPAQFWNGPYTVLINVAPEYFKTLKIRFLSGQDFSDGYSGSAVAIVNQELVHKFLSGRNPIGSRISLASRQADWRQIVGVVADVPQSSIEKKPEPQIFFPLVKLEVPWLALAVRVSGEPLGFITPIRQAIAKVDPTVAVFLPRTMEQILERQFLWRSLQSWVVGAFAVLAITLATLGVYAVIAYSVSQRRKELGLRMALGASSGGLRRLVLWQGAKPALVGAALGLLGGLIASRATTSLLFGTTASDPAVYATAAIILVVAALAASLFPAMRASATDPSNVLRHE